MQIELGIASWQAVHQFSFDMNGHKEVKSPSHEILLTTLPFQELQPKYPVNLSLCFTIETKSVQSKMSNISLYLL